MAVVSKVVSFPFFPSTLSSITYPVILPFASVFVTTLVTDTSRPSTSFAYTIFVEFHQG